MPISRQMKGRDAIAAPRGWRGVCRLHGGRRSICTLDAQCSRQGIVYGETSRAAVSLLMAGDMSLKNRGRIALCLQSYARFSTSKEDCIVGHFSKSS